MLTAGAHGGGGIVTAEEDLTQSFKEAMSAFAGGVVMVTSWADGRPWGLTISACCSISADPPKLLVSLGRHTRSRQAALEDGAFGVSILSSRHTALARVGSRPGVAKFVDDFCEPHGAPRDAPGDALSDAPPRIRGALANLDCALDRAFEVHDHTLIVGDVRRVHLLLGRDAEASVDPLLYFDRAYRAVGERIA